MAAGTNQQPSGVVKPALRFVERADANAVGAIQSGRGPHQVTFGVIDRPPQNAIAVREIDGLGGTVAC